jgi:predicted ABC-type ATPase
MTPRQIPRSRRWDRFLWSKLERRPIIVAVAGPNGAGKTTFYNANLKRSGLPFLNADVVAAGLEIDPYEAARTVERLRDALLLQGESFIFETVFSDPVGDKLAFLTKAAQAGYTVVLCFIGVSGPELSVERVAMRVSQGGHDVPTEKLLARFPSVLANLKAAIQQLPCVLVYDNENLKMPFRQIGIFEDGHPVEAAEILPRWARGILP